MNTYTTMTRSNLTSSLLASALLLAAGLVASPFARAGQEKLAAQMAETSTQVTQTRNQLDATMAALKSLVRQKEGDLKAAYAGYCREVALTQTAAAWTRQCGENMAAQGKQYFADWQQELEGISNAKLRRQAERRLAKVQKRYGNVTKALETAGGKFKPFLSDLGDIEKVLAKDLTAGGIKSLRGTVSSAEFNLGPIRRAINTAVGELEKMSRDLQPQAK
jgi:hypothetical protein